MISASTDPLAALSWPGPAVVSIALRHMKTTNTDAVLAASMALATVLAHGLAIALAHGLALAIVAAERLTGRQLIRTGQASPPLPPAPPARPLAALPAAAAPALDSLPVRELRALARSAGHRALARSGRRAELLAVLA